MGNSCAAKSNAGLSPGQRNAAMDKYRLTEQQVLRVEDLFKQSATNRKYLTLKDFRDLYSESRFDHDDEDIQAVFRAIGESSGKSATAAAGRGSSSLKPPVDRVTFDGFVRLSLLCRHEVTEGGGGGSSSRSGNAKKRSNGGSSSHGSHHGKGGRQAKSAGKASSHGNGDENHDDEAGDTTTGEIGGNHGNSSSSSNNNNNNNNGEKSSGTDSVDGKLAADLIDRDRMRVLFDVMDSDSSGTISESEFHRFILNFVDDQTTASGIFGKLDHDKNRTIDFDEFCAFCRKHRKVFRAMCSYVFPID